MALPTNQNSHQVGDTNVIIHKVANIMLSPTSLCDKYERFIIDAFESVFYWLEGLGHTLTVL